MSIDVFPDSSHAHIRSHLKRAVSVRQFLSEELALRKGKSPSISQRAFARRLGISHSFLSYVLNGKRSLGPGMIPRISQALGLNADETLHLQDLVAVEAGFGDFSQKMPDTGNWILQVSLSASTGEADAPRIGESVPRAGDTPPETRALLEKLMGRCIELLSGACASDVQVRARLASGTNPLQSPSGNHAKCTVSFEFPGSSLRATSHPSSGPSP